MAIQKKAQKTVEEGRIYIKSTFNNTLITITDIKGNPLLTSSCGMYGFSGTRKSTPHAATITTDSAIKKAVTEYGLQSIEIFVKGIGPGREAALRVIKGTNLDIKKITDITPIPHNGVRPPKVRRV
jgi:small subunit ribosomal protein S11